MPRLKKVKREGRRHSLSGLFVSARAAGQSGICLASCLIALAGKAKGDSTEMRTWEYPNTSAPNA